MGTPNSPVCVFSEKSEISLRSGSSMNIVSLSTEVILSKFLGTCDCIWPGQVAKLLDASAEWRMSCAFKTGKYGKNVDWKGCRSGCTGTAETDETWNREGKDGQVWYKCNEHLLTRLELEPCVVAHAWTCANVTVHALWAEKCACNKWVFVHSHRAHCGRHCMCTKPRKTLSRKISTFITPWPSWQKILQFVAWVRNPFF